jgi:hypothetical protein
MEWNRENRSFVISDLDEETSFLNSCHYCHHSLCEKWRGTPKGKAKGSTPCLYFPHIDSNRTMHRARLRRRG